jgi:hypothetical protein
MIDSRWADDAAQPNLVDEFYVPYVRALGNLVVLFGQAETALLQLVATVKRADEKSALQVLKQKDARKQVLALVEASGMDGFERTELLESVARFWSDKDQRHRYMHDEWYVGIGENDAVAATRGLRTKDGMVMWDAPKPEQVWELAFRFREHRSVFSSFAYSLRKRDDDEGT